MAEKCAVLILSYLTRLIAQNRRVGRGILRRVLVALFEVADVLFPSVANAAGDRTACGLAFVAMKGGASAVRCGQVAAGDGLVVEELPAPLAAGLVRDGDK